MSDQQTTPPKPVVHPARCWCALTPDGTLIPWLCDTDRERLQDRITELRKPWRTVPVNIVLDEASA